MGTVLATRTGVNTTTRLVHRRSRQCRVSIQQLRVQGLHHGLWPPNDQHQQISSQDGAVRDSWLRQLSDEVLPIYG